MFMFLSWKPKAHTHVFKSKPTTMKLTLRLSIVFIGLFNTLLAIAQQSGNLYEEIFRVDSLMFSTAQKDCDLESYASYLADDFEYFHDKAGFLSWPEGKGALSASI